MSRDGLLRERDEQYTQHVHAVWSFVHLSCLHRPQESYNTAQVNERNDSKKDQYILLRGRDLSQFKDSSFPTLESLLLCFCIHDTDPWSSNVLCKAFDCNVCCLNLNYLTCRPLTLPTCPGVMLHFSLPSWRPLTHSGLWGKKGLPYINSIAFYSILFT